MARQPLQLLNAVFQIVPVGIGVIDRSGAMVLCNAAMQEFLPTRILPSRDCARSGRWKGLGADGARIHAKDFPGMRALRGENVLPGVEMLYEHDDGTQTWTRVSAVPVRNSTGQIAGAVAVVTNIDAMKKSEAALRDSEASFRSLAAERKELLDAERAARAEADNAARAKDDFLATVSHEIRTPLSNVISWARILQSQPGQDKEALSRGLKIIVDNALSQSQLISDLLDMSRIVSGKFDLELEHLDLGYIVDSTFTAQRPSAQRKGIRFECRKGKDLGFIFADGPRLRQVFSNLLSNAIKFTPAGGRVCVQTRRDGEEFLVEVEDSGEGIDATFAPLLFERFRQGDTSQSRRHGGLGLGLSIAKQIVEMHGGRIKAHSDGHDKGSLFTVTLPAAPPYARRTVLADISGRGASAAANGTLEGIRVLAVEDQSDMREYLQRTLEDHHATVTTVDSAAGALQVLCDHPHDPPFDVLLSDVGLPETDGYELIRIVRQELELEAERLPAVAVTAYARREDREHALEAGYQAHLSKPYNTSLLIALVRRLGHSR